MNPGASTTAKLALTALGAIHLAVAIWHGQAHTELGVALSPAQNLFVYVVVVLAPLVAIGLLWTRYTQVGVWLFLIALSGSFLFGVYYHFVFVSPDNIHHLPPGSEAAHARFVHSAAILAVVELVSALAAAFVIRAQHRSA